MRNQSPGGKGLNLPPPSSDEDSNPDDNDKSDGGSNESDEESSKSSSKPEPKYYRPSFNRPTNEEVPPTASAMVDHYFDDAFVENCSRARSGV